MKGIYFHLRCVLIANRITFIGWRIEVIAGEYFYCDIKKISQDIFFLIQRRIKQYDKTCNFCHEEKYGKFTHGQQMLTCISDTFPVQNVHQSAICIWSIFSYKQGHLAGQTFRIDICRSWYSIVLHVCKPSQGNLQ